MHAKSNFIEETNIYIDDVRGNPDALGIWTDPFGIKWTVARTNIQCITLLKRGNIGILSIDHTASDLLAWLREQRLYNIEPQAIPKEIRIHSEDPRFFERMEDLKRKVYK